MSRSPLHLVVDNEPAHAKDESSGSWVTPEQAAKIDFAALVAHSRYVFALSKLILLAPLQLIAFIWRVGITAGVGVVRGFLRVVLGMFGLALIGWVAFAILRVLFHPIFHYYLTH